MADPSIVRFRRVVATSLAELENRREEVNDLNVFPVADGDTGDNMAMTLRAVLQELDGLSGQAGEQVERGELVTAVARAALLGARGNSGVILSQIVRGAAEELASRQGELIDPVLVSAAFARAADAAYASVRDPAEGTMLSVVRAMALRVSHDLAHVSVQRLNGEATPEQQDELLAAVLEGALESANEALDRGPDQLPILKEHGVVDAGAYGLTVILSGFIAALRGTDPPALEHRAPENGTHHHLPQHDSVTFRYCTNFAVTGTGLVGQLFKARLEELGDSVLVVGDERTLRVHVHTDDPDAAVAVFDGTGEVSRLDVADMQEQVADREKRLGTDAAAARASARCAVVAVVSGAGLTELYEQEHALVIDGGPTLNPSTYELLAGVHAAGAAEVIVLPNSPNVIMAAERAAGLSDVPCRVVPTTAQQEGLAALIAFNPDLSAEDNAAAMAEESSALTLGGVAESAKEDPEGRFKPGDALGYARGELIAWGQPEDTLRATMAAVCDGAELLTCVSGAGAPLDDDRVEALVPDGIELEQKVGGQPAWWWLLSAE